MKMNTDNLFELVKVFLTKTGNSLNLEELKLQLLSHPTYPSLHSVTGVLTHFGIDNVAVDVPIDQETLEQLPDVFFSLTSRHKYIIVEKRNDSVKVYQEGEGKWKNIPNEDFLKDWSGIVLGIDDEITMASKEIGSVAYKPGWALALLSFALLGGLIYLLKPGVINLLYFFFGLMGFAISILIVSKRMGFKNSAVDKMCSGGEATSCNDVLESPSAQIFNLINLSDLSLVYFASTSIAWIVCSLLQVPNSLLILITALSVPMIGYSVYYQGFVIKKWCTLCLGIVGVLLLQFFVSFLNPSVVLNVQEIGVQSTVLLAAILLSSIAWSVLKPLLEAKANVFELTVKYFKFKRNFDLFEAAFLKSDEYDMALEDNQHQEIVLGNPEAQLNFTLVTNPKCIYCKQAHMDVEKILDKFSDSVRVNIRFNVNPDDKSFDGFKVSNRLIAIYNSEFSSKTNQALHEAYEDDVDFDQWLTKWDAIGPEKDYSNLMKAQKHWCAKTGINFTPALLLQGRELPNMYERTDIIHFIEDILEAMESSPVLDGEIELSTATG